jgi:hypothetical protein
VIILFFLISVFIWCIAIAVTVYVLDALECRPVTRVGVSMIVGMVISSSMDGLRLIITNS